MTDSVPRRLLLEGLHPRGARGASRAEVRSAGEKGVGERGEGGVYLAPRLNDD